MNPKVVTNYMAWARRGYLTPLSCPADQLDLMVEERDGLWLKCVFCDYKKQIGLAFYEELKTKAKVAELMHGELN